MQEKDGEGNGEKDEEENGHEHVKNCEEVDTKVKEMVINAREIWRR